MKNNRKRILWITCTAVFVALLITAQSATSALGNSLLTGSIVNLLLIISVMTCGLASGLTVAVISPIIAKFLGIGPFWSFIPFIIAGNITLAALWHFIGNRQHTSRKFTAYIAALLCSSVAKFLVLYVGVVQIVIPLFLNLPAPQASVLSNMFSVAQLFTALIGGVVAIIVLPVLKNAVRKSQKM